MVMGTWTGGRRRIKPSGPKKIKTLVVTDPLLFSKRDKRNIHFDPLQWSEDALRQASEAWPQVLIFCPVPEDLVDPNETSSRPTDLHDFVESLGLSNVMVSQYSVRHPENATKIWKTRIMELGGTFKPAKNPREIAYLNLQRHVQGKHLTWVKGEDHIKAKIEIDKEKSFKDLQDMRKKKAEW
jgi:hypothetical protein